MMTVLQAFLTIEDPEFRKFVFDNLDARYLDKPTYTLGYALTFGVLTGGERSKWLKIENYINYNLGRNRTKEIDGGGNERKLYKHECKSCVYLGKFSNEDLYYHPVTPLSLIARYGNNASEYTSGFLFAEAEKDDVNSPLGEAYRRCVERNYIIPKTEI